MTKRTAPLHVMEYLNERATGVIGWVLLSPGQYKRWAGAPTSRRTVQGYCIVSTMEDLAEIGSVPCARLRDYHHTIAAAPKKPFTEDALTAQFEMAANHPARE
jgi:hypothetical protein